VRYVLEGSVQRSGNQMRVNAQLVDAETDSNLWAERLDGEIGDLFALQNEITRRLANALGIELIAAEALRPTERTDALSYILRGRAAALRLPSRENYAEKVSLFERALKPPQQRGEAMNSVHCRRDADGETIAALRSGCHAVSLLFGVLLAAFVGISTTPAAAATCASLASLAFPDTTITAAQPIPAGTYTAHDGEVFTNLPAFCRIAATLTPTPDSDINIELWMPFSNWNGRFAGTGNFNLGGVIVYSSLPGGLHAGTAVTNTDMGTSPAATEGSRALVGHPEKQIDYATRSTHLMTVRSKQFIKAFYGEPPKHSYFIGCSAGGGQAIHEALQFPGDYDGIEASAPAMNFTHFNAGFVWDAQAFDGRPILRQTRRPPSLPRSSSNAPARTAACARTIFLTDREIAIGIRQRCNAPAGRPMHPPA
jgi:hypothetical protein